MKKKLLLLCTFLISFMIYIDGVEAFTGEELTCIYKNGYWVIQKSDCTKLFYKHLNSTPTDDLGWEKMSSPENNYSDVDDKNIKEYDKDGKHYNCLSTCPKAVQWSGTSQKFLFSDIATTADHREGSLWYALSEQKNKIIKPGQNKTYKITCVYDKGNGKKPTGAIALMQDENCKKTFWVNLVRNDASTDLNTGRWVNLKANNNNYGDLELTTKKGNYTCLNYCPSGIDYALKVENHELVFDENNNGKYNIVFYQSYSGDNITNKLKNEYFNETKEVKQRKTASNSKLTCVYRAGKIQKPLWFVQNSDCTKEFYVHKNQTVNTEDGAWVKIKTPTNNFYRTIGGTYISNKDKTCLNACPQYVDFEVEENEDGGFDLSNDEKNIRFKDIKTEDDEYTSLVQTESKVDVVKKPKKKGSNELTCIYKDISAVLVKEHRWIKQNNDCSHEIYKNTTSYEDRGGWKKEEPEKIEYKDKNYTSECYEFCPDYLYPSTTFKTIYTLDESCELSYNCAKLVDTRNSADAPRNEGNALKEDEDSAFENSNLKLSCYYFKDGDINEKTRIYIFDDHYSMMWPNPDKYAAPGDKYTNDTFTFEDLQNEYPNSCPNEIYYTVIENMTGNLYNYSLRKGDSTDGFYELFQSNNGEKHEYNGTITEYNNLCVLIDDDIQETINDVMKIIRLVVPILLLIFGVLDFAKATFSSKEENMENNRKKFFKRIIAALIVFIIPLFVKLVLKIANNVWENINSETCIEERN